jgi:predicted RNA-binding Zn ribbon-like protein
MLTDSLDAATARRFRTGRRCLDFAHTGGVGDWMAAELVHAPADAAYWLAMLLDLDPSDIRARARDLQPVREVREAIWQLAQSAVAGTRFAAEHVDVVNRAAAAAPPREQLSADGTRRTVVPVDVRQALSALARDAIDLFTGPLSERIRRCAADDCGLLFVDASRPGQRRWCSMNRCGSRAKMRRYRGG